MHVVMCGVRPCACPSMCVSIHVRGGCRIVLLNTSSRPNQPNHCCIIHRRILTNKSPPPQIPPPEPGASPPDLDRFAGEERYIEGMLYRCLWGLTPQKKPEVQLAKKVACLLLREARKVQTEPAERKTNIWKRKLAQTLSKLLIAVSSALLAIS